MLTVVIILLALFLIYVGGGNGEWGVVAIAVVGALVLLGGLSGLKSSSRAYWNWVGYWSRRRR